MAWLGYAILINIILIVLVFTITYIDLTVTSYILKYIANDEIGSLGWQYIINELVYAVDK